MNHNNYVLLKKPKRTIDDLDLFDTPMVGIFKNKKYTILTVLITALGIFLLSTAAKTLPLGIAYAVWTGLGTVFTVLFGIIVFGESRDKKKMLFMIMVVAGVIGLRLCS